MRRALICILALPMLLLAALPANALDFSQKVMGPDDKPLTRVIEPAERDANGRITKEAVTEDSTLGWMVAQALFAALPGEEKMAGDEKFARGNLALKIRSGGEVNVSVEEIAIMKKVVAAAYGPLLVARIWPLLDPGAAAKPEPKAEIVPQGVAKP